MKHFCSLRLVVTLLVVPLQISFSQGDRSLLDSITIGVPIHSGWNILSNPVRRTDDTISHLFPTCSPCTISFWPPWRWTCTSPRGMGIWEKCVGVTTSFIEGEAVERDSFIVTTGWNLVGSISYSVPTSSVTSSPPGIIVSRFFHHNGAYVVADSIMPGLGYWVKANGPGRIVLVAPTVQHYK